MNIRIILTLNVLICNIKNIDSLLCYNCDKLEESQSLCHENMPQLCTSATQGCVAIRDKSLLSKRCESGCSSRGDSWNDDCYICDKDFCNLHDVGEKPHATVAVAPPDTYTHNDSTYTLFAEARTYWEALTECQKRRKTLVSIKSESVQDFLLTQLDHTLMKENKTIHGFWLGAISADGNPWLWQDTGDPVSLSNKGACLNNSFQNWMTTQPLKNEKGRYFCGVFMFESSGGWNSVSCGKKAAAFVCEGKEDISGSPSHEVVRSIVYRGNVYSYYSQPKMAANLAHQTCINKGSQLATLSVRNVQQNVNARLLMPNNFEEYWSKKRCRRGRNRNQQEEFKFACSDELPFMCQKPLKEFNISRCREDITSSSCTMVVTTPVSMEPIPNNITERAIEITTPRPVESVQTTSVMQDSKNLFCIGINITYNNLTYSFPSTISGNVADSSEVCPSSGGAMATLSCQFGSNHFNDSSLQFAPCSSSLEDVKIKLENLSGLKSNDFEKYSQETYFYTSSNNLTQDDVQDSVDILLTLDKQLEGVDNQFEKANNETDSLATVTPIVLSNVVRSVNNLCDEVVTVKQQLDLQLVMENFVSHVSINSSGQLSLSTENIHLQVSDTSENINKSLSLFADFDNSTISMRHHSNVFRAYVIRYKNASLFPSSQNVGEVITATALNNNRDQISVPINFTMQRSNYHAYNHCIVETCSFYDQVNQSWSSHGCQRVANRNNDVISCMCNHTTSFAVVVDVQSKHEDVALDIASEVGLALSVFFLLLTVVLFIKIPELQRVRSAHIHINLCLCLAITYLVFLFGINLTFNRALCVSIAAGIHFTLLSAWGWMAVESITMYRMFVTSFDRLGLGDIKKMAISVYLTSAFIVAATLLGSMFSGLNTESCVYVDIWSNYVGDRYCWLTGAALYSFVGIVGLILLINIALAFLVIKAITWGRRKVTSSVDETSAIHVLRAVLVAVLLGVSWIFAIPIVLLRNHTAQLVFGWLFAISTSGQGLFVFYFFCMRRSEVRRAWVRPLLTALRCGHQRKLRHGRKAESEEVGQSASRRSESTGMTSSKSWRRLTSSGRGNARTHTAAAPATAVL